MAMLFKDRILENFSSPGRINSSMIHRPNCFNKIFITVYCCCCYSVTKSYLTLCDPMDWSMPSQYHQNIQSIFCKRFWESFRFNFIFSFAEDRPNHKNMHFYQSNSPTCKVKSIVSGASLVAHW